jgi:hypothetical protein
VTTLLLHNLAWSLEQGRLHELFLHDGITFATWGLVAVTVLLVGDGWRRSKEQQARWKREDEQRQKEHSETQARWRREDDRLEESLRPKFRFGLSRVAVQVILHGMNYHKWGLKLWVTNFGDSAIYVQAVHVKRRNKLKGVMPVNRIVPAGGELHLDLPDTGWQTLKSVLNVPDGVYLWGDYEVSLSLLDAAHQFTSDSCLYFWLYTNHSFEEFSPGAHEPRHPICPTCNNELTNLGLRTTRLNSEENLQADVWEPMLTDLVKSCPDHQSEFLRNL